jgi:hypothetical protein
VWNGDLRFDILSDLKAWVGYGRPTEFTIDAAFPAQAPERIRIGYGTLVLRR